MGIEHYWVAEYSVSQKCGHICRLGQTIGQNISSVMRRVSTDFVLIHISEDRKECELVLAELTKKKPPEKSRG